MIRIDYLICGYVTVTVDKSNVSGIASLLWKKQINVRIGADGVFHLPYRRLKTILPLLDGTQYKISEVKGLYGFLLSKRKRYGFIAALFVSFFLFLFLNSMVWDVRIEGIESADEEEIINELGESGLYVGAFWSRIDKSNVEVRMLSKSDNISWLNINRRGSVAYVKVVEKDIHTIPDEPLGYANIVATRDCIIEEITVKRGVAAVKVGDSVRVGQLLISGVIPTELGGGYCYAEGSVKGRFAQSISVSVSKSVTEKIYTEEKLGELSLKIFGFPINILKMGGNSENSCDIIEKKKDFELLGTALPFSADYTVLMPYTENSYELPADRLTDAASNALRERLLAVTADADLISISTGGGFTADGYTMSAELILRADVVAVKEFDFSME